VDDLNTQEIITQIAVPIFSAIIGGGMTLWGVKMTLRKEQKAEEAQKKAECMPFLFSVNDQATVDLDSVIHYTFGLGKASEDIAFVGVQGRIKNIGQKAYILDRIETPNFTYVPLDGSVVDVGRVCQVYIYAEDNLDTEWTLYVRDLLGNQYKYEMLDVQTQVFRINGEIGQGVQEKRCGEKKQQGKRKWRKS